MSSQAVQEQRAEGSANRVYGIGGTEVSSLQMLVNSLPVVGVVIHVAENIITLISGSEQRVNLTSCLNAQVLPDAFMVREETLRLTNLSRMISSTSTVLGLITLVALGILSSGFVLISLGLSFGLMVSSVDHLDVTLREDIRGVVNRVAQRENQ